MTISMMATKGKFEVTEGLYWVSGNVQTGVLKADVGYVVVSIKNVKEVSRRYDNHSNNPTVEAFTDIKKLC